MTTTCLLVPPRRAARVARIVHALAFVVAGLTACVSGLPLDERPCPCATGWLCCADANICVAAGASCPVPSGAAAPGLSLLAGQLGGRGSADGIGSQARLQFPSAGVFVGGLLYFVDYYAIRSLDVGTGAVRTVAGSNGPDAANAVGIGKPGVDGVGAQVRFGFPRGLADDGQGGLLITDGDKIRRMLLSSGAVSTLVTVAAPVVDVSNAAWLESAAYDGQGGLYVTIHSRHALQRIALDTGAVSLVAGSDLGAGSDDGVGAAARFNRPGALVLDAVGGRLLVADTGNSTIRAVDLVSHQVTTLAGSAGVPGTLDAQGTAARVGSVSGLSLLPGGVGTLEAIDYDGVRGWWRSIDLASGQVRSYSSFELAGAGDALIAADAARGVYLGIGGTIALASTPNNVPQTVAGLAPAPGSANGIGGTARFSALTELATDDQGHVFVKDGSAIRQIDLATAAVTALAGLPGSAGHVDGIGAAARFPDSFTGGLVADGAGHLFVVDTDDSTVRQVDLATRQVSTLCGVYRAPGVRDGIGAAAWVRDPRGLVADGQGHLYVGSAGSSPLRRITIATGEVTTVAGEVSKLTALAPFDMDGQTLYAFHGSNLLAIDVATGSWNRLYLGGCSGPPVDGPLATSCIDAPSAAHLDGAGGLYLADRTVVRRIDLAARTVTTVIGSASRAAGVQLGALPAGLNLPFALAFSGSRLVIADRNEYSVLIADLPPVPGR